MWLSVDPLADKYISNTPYMYCSGNPIVRVDPDGRADYYDIDGNHLYNDGNDDRKVFQQCEQGDVYLDGYTTPFSYVGEVDRVSMEYNAKMCNQTSKKSIGVLIASQFVGDKEFKQNFDACSGTNSKYYTLQNGTYSCWRYRVRDKNSYTWEGVGFSIELFATFTTKRTGLQIHPDGSQNTPSQHDGTMGCIGLLGNATELQQFIRTVIPFIPQSLPTSPIVPLNVNVIGNPDCYQADPLILGRP